MQYSYMRFGKRIALPSIIQILDDLDPDYRKRLLRENRQRPNPPRPVVLPALRPARS